MQRNGFVLFIKCKHTHKKQQSASLLSSIATVVVGSASTFISMLIVDKVGRRELFLFRGVKMFVSQIMIGGIMAVMHGK